MSTRRRISRASGLVLGALSILALSACSGTDEPVSTGKSPAEVMALAKDKLDTTTGLHLSLKTDNLPDGVTGIKAAEGVANHEPAFDGKITVVLSGQAVEVPVIAVDGKVHVQLPLTPGWQDIDPGDYGAPDPAQLMSPDAGFSALLPATTGLADGGSVRGGVDNKEVLTKYTGSVPDTAVANVIPTAHGAFEAAYTITASGELRQAELTGDFYDNGSSMTYTVGFDEYGTQTDISAP
ncbi:MAG: LppX LprAFG lipoprotein [Nocardioides sp.]|nr:LppX LprAFG lipoprotein [Nocardioides sp.]